MNGRLVRILNLGYRKAGSYISGGKAAHWDGRNDAGERMASGVYLYEIQAGEFKAIGRMVMIK